VDREWNNVKCVNLEHNSDQLRQRTR